MSNPKPKSLGILGGTFDPPHYGHLALAENGHAQLQLNRVLFVPAGQQPHKLDQGTTPAHHRAAMVEAAIADNPAFTLSRIDLDRPGPHYTTDMLTLLQKAYPGTALFFLIGSDSLAQLTAWHDAAGIVQRARLVVMQRPGWEADLTALEQAVSGIGQRLDWLDTPNLDISASDLRRRVCQGLPLRYLVPPPVVAYINKHRLYTGDSE